MLHGHSDIAERSSKHLGRPVSKEATRKWVSKYGLPVERDRFGRVRILESALLAWLDA